MACINAAEFVVISFFEKDHSMIETCRLTNVTNFIQTIIRISNKSITKSSKGNPKSI